VSAELDSLRACIPGDVLQLTVREAAMMGLKCDHDEMFRGSVLVVVVHVDHASVPAIITAEHRRTGAQVKIPVPPRPPLASDALA
jgi:hypothetical protein